MAKKLKSLEEQKDLEHIVLEGREQILHRSGQWIGSKTTKEVEHYVFNDKKKIFELKKVLFNEACAKLIEEVFTNSIDEHINTKLNPKLRGWVLDKVDVTVEKNGHVIIEDNGGISSALHPKGGRTVEVIFNNLFSSSNYDDREDKKRIKTGTNGVGAKLANIFSKSFRVTSADNKEEVSVLWTDNFENKEKAVIKKIKKHYTKIEFMLDLEMFNMKEIPQGVIDYIERRCIMACGFYNGLEVNFNSKKYKFSNSIEYINMYHKDQIIKDSGEGWEVFITPNIDKNNHVHGIVNGCECNEGTHIKRYERLINNSLRDHFETKKIENNLTYNMISNAYNLFVFASVDKPEYNSQNKTELTTQLDSKDFNINDSFKNKVNDSAIFKYLVQQSKAQKEILNSKEIKKLVKDINDTNPKTVQKLIDATETLKSKRKNCEFWIFEGNSASSGFRANRIPKTQGAYPLKGKFTNTINIPLSKAMKNKEVSDLFIATGINPKDKNDMSKLRYGQFNLCTDMDVDGHSITAQLITFFYMYCPNIIKKGMLYRVITPLYKATKGKDIKYYYDLESFKKEEKKLKGYDITYFKGIGSLEKIDYKTMLREKTIYQRINFTEECEEIMQMYMMRTDEMKEVLIDG